MPEIGLVLQELRTVSGMLSAMSRLRTVMDAEAPDAHLAPLLAALGACIGQARSALEAAQASLSAEAASRG